MSFDLGYVAMIAVVTGMVGIDKKAYLEGVCEAARERGNDVGLFNVGDMMYSEASDIRAGRILDISLKRLGGLRRSVIKDIISRKQEHSHLIVNTHATFRWRHGLFPAFDFDQMRQLGADIYVCMVDGVEALHVRLTQDHPVNHSLKDLLVWREEEILGTELMCDGAGQGGEYYCMSRGEGLGTVETFYRLMFEREMDKVYLSFPMTHVMGNAAVERELGEFRSRMKERFICFDPGDLEEACLPCMADEALANGEDKVKLGALGVEFEIDARELKSIESDINSQIYTRDFALIDQSDMIVSYVPALADGRPAISSGVERELQHGHEAAKEVYVIWTADSAPSVFVTQTASRVFGSLEEAEEFFLGKESANEG